MQIETISPKTYRFTVVFSWEDPEVLKEGVLIKRKSRCLNELEHKQKIDLIRAESYSAFGSLDSLLYQGSNNNNICNTMLIKCF